MGAAVLAALAVAGTAYGAYATNKAGDEYQDSIKNYKTFDPEIPGASKTVDWQDIIKKVTGMYRQTQGQRQAVGSATNKFNLDEARKMYRGMQPYFDQLQSQIGKNALSFSKGELPADVIANIGRAAATAGIKGGFGYGSGGALEGTALGNLNLRNLGLTSLDLSKYGSDLGMRVNQAAKDLSPPLFDINSLMVTPQQAIGYQFQNVGIENEQARYINQLINSAKSGNVGIANQANQLGANAQLSSELAQAQMWQQLGSSLGGMYMSGTGGMGTGGTFNMMGSGHATNAAGVPNAGVVPGYRYNPTTGYALV